MAPKRALQARKHTKVQSDHGGWSQKQWDHFHLPGSLCPSSGLYPPTLDGHRGAAGVHKHRGKGGRKGGQFCAACPGQGGGHTATLFNLSEGLTFVDTHRELLLTEKVTAGL
eukprot:TRINITY_DN68167_c8_g2_i1.p2 TRINITY_DN68167_c8_g2~~TRINITY_DN68167_c8_g2_i1.p2  ORF type:complete len:112 (-),score=3.59 TRINITY_DN68167_c8_g2_i1:165-500(-)